MRNSTRFMLAACILAAAPAAVSGAAPAFAAAPGSAHAAPAKHSWMSTAGLRRASSGALLFVSDYTNNVVDIYSADNPGSMVGQIAGMLNFPAALAVDAANNLYVYNGRTNSILEFAPPYTGVPFKTYFDGLTGIESVTVDSSGTVYATNDVTDEIVEYPKGDTHALVIPLPVGPNGATVDAKGRLVSVFTGGGSGGALRMTRKSPIPQSLLIPLATSPADVLFDLSGNLVIEDSGGAYINIYAPGKTKPMASWTAGFLSPNHMALSADGQSLYVSDSGANTVTGFAYPSGQQLWQLTGFAQVGGVAVSPAVVPGGRGNNLAPFPAVSRNSLGRWIPPVKPEKNHFVSLVPRNVPIDTHPAWARLENRLRSHGSTQDQAWVAPIHFGVSVLRYALPNNTNDPPNCQTPLLYGLNSIGVDFSGNLWIPAYNNGPRTGTAQEFTCGSSVGQPINDYIGQPSDVAFDGKGNVIVGDIVNFLPNQGGWYLDSGTASAYDGTGKYLGSLSDPTFFSPHPPGFDTFNILDAVANDANGNCYVSHVSNSGGGEVVEFPGCKPAKRGNVLKGPHPWSAGKAAFDASGNMIITDFAYAGYYRVWYAAAYAPPYNKGPINTLASMYGPAVSCALASSQTDLYFAPTPQTATSTLTPIRAESTSTASIMA